MRTEINPFTGEEETMETESRRKELDIRGEITNVTSSFCSFTPETKEEKKMLFNAVNSTPESLSDHINEVLEIQHIYAEAITVSDETSGEELTIPRIVLIDTTGIGYGCASKGIFHALRKLIQIMGMPSSENIYKIKVKQAKTKKNNWTALTFELAE